MKSILSTMLLSLFTLAATIHCQGQNHQPANVGKPVGGGCDGCEIMYVGMPRHINATDTSAGWYETGQKLLVSGTVYRQDGKTPAPDVVVYYWQTNHEGYYAPRPNLDRRAARHGYIRGWVKTNAAGKYAIYTIRPGAYPNQTIPAHIHLSIKEPEIANEYYIDDFVFDDDPLLTAFEREKMERRGGSGILRPQMQSRMQVAAHDMILGLNIPGYPGTTRSGLNSGLAIGEESPSFTPFHSWGPDKGSIACPVCKYGKNFGVLYFVGNHPDWPEIKKWLLFLEKKSEQVPGKLKVYFVYGNEKDFSKGARLKELQALGEALKIRHLALTFVPSFTDQESDVALNRVDPEVLNTFIVYKNRVIIDRYINLAATQTNFERIFSKVHF